MCAMPSKYLSICFIKIYTRWRRCRCRCHCQRNDQTNGPLPPNEGNEHLAQRPKMSQYLRFHSIERDNPIGIGGGRRLKCGQFTFWSSFIYRMCGNDFNRRPVSRFYTIASCFNGICCSFSTMQSEISFVCIFLARSLSHPSATGYLCSQRTFGHTHTHTSEPIPLCKYFCVEISSFEVLSQTSEWTEWCARSLS